MKMIRMVLASAALFGMMAASQPVSAFARFSVGLGKNLNWEGADNSALWGGITGSPAPGQPGYDNWGKPYGSPFANTNIGSPFAGRPAVPNYSGQPNIPTPQGYVQPRPYVVPMGSYTTPAPVPPPNAPRPATPAPAAAPKNDSAPGAARPVSYTPYQPMYPGPMPFVQPWWYGQ